MIMTILRARDVAGAIPAHSEAERRAAFAALHASADLNKDQRRASAVAPERPPRRRSARCARR
ncbi:hypothetical protein FNJ84_20850 [Paracoccus sp. M683]|uniref:hypothetical protein n=1 Tax=Paracoccus sp. M683 TaxID=2594268 RepID=UPI00117C4EAF|nr:hypothetical protein [Paracoccus sp. M683]TRW92855.1 hypothetical protein FNJ84_20850 [Paracoccus sp. M683]